MPVEVWKVTTPLQQAKAIADRMERRHTDGVAWSEMACLFRCLKRGDRGKLYTILEDELMRRAVPYVIVGGKTLLERASVLDLMSYIRLAVGHDDQAFRRVLYRPKRRLSQKVLAAIERQQHIMEQDRTEWGHVGLDEAARVMVKTGVGIKQAQREHLRGLLAILDKIRDRCVIEQLPEMLSFVWTESGLGKMHGAKVQQSDSGSEEAEAEEADSDEEGDEENGLNAAQIPQSRLSVPPEIARLLDIAMAHANAFKTREAHLQRSNDDGTRVPKLFEMTRTYVLENEMMTSRLRKHLPKCILDELYVDQGRGRRIVQSFISEITLQETSEPDISGKSTDAETVTISSVHRAKGLEWCDVYIPFFNDGFLPTSFRDSDNSKQRHRPACPTRIGESPGKRTCDEQCQEYFIQAEIRTRGSPQERHADEERRLAHVAATRAKDALFFVSVDTELPSPYEEELTKLPSRVVVSRRME
jgi:superfamily I DNA/RNA helicase